jgi:hypothetical protein
MNCERCKGLLLLDRYNILANVDLREYMMWRCVNCGNIVDAQIMIHRAQRHRRPAAATVEQAHVDAVCSEATL